MRDAGVPLMPGSDGVVRNLGRSKAAANKVGYPVMIKAAARRRRARHARRVAVRAN